MSGREDACIFILAISIIMSFHYMVVSILNLPEDTVLLRGTKIEL